MVITAYRSTAVFDETTLPEALRREHRTKAGTWGVIRVIEGALRLRFIDSAEEMTLTPGHPGIVLPGQTHCVEAVGRMRMQVDFYDRPPPASP